MFGFGKKKEERLQEQHKLLNQREETRARIKEIIQSSPIVNLLACKFCVLSGLAHLKLLADTIGDYGRIERAYKLIGAKLADNKDANDVLKLSSKMECITVRATEEIGKKADELADYMVSTPIDNFSEDVIKSKKEDIERIRKWASALNGEIEETIKFIICAKLSGIIDEAIRSASNDS